MQEIRIKTLFAELAAIRTGGETGPRVLALHGWLDNAATFLPLMKYLPDVDFVALDLPGHGLSSHRSQDASYLFADWVREVFAAADALGWQSFHLLGHSMGAGIAALASVAEPNRVLSFCGLDGLMPYTSEADEVVQRLRDYVRDSLRVRRAVSFPSMEAALTIRARAGEFEHLEGLRAVVERNVREEGGRFYLRSDRRLMTHNPLRFTRSHITQLIKGVEAPVHIVVAEKGLPFVKEQVQLLGPSLKHFELTEVPGFHHVHLDAPERVVGSLRQAFFAAL